MQHINGKLAGQIVMTADIARARANDVGNTSMRAAGRTQWNQEDAKAAHAEFVRLMPAHASMPEGVKRRA